MYNASLGSQAEQLGFRPPMAHVRRGTFQSSYDPSVRFKAGPNFKGTVCPEGHMCMFRVYGKSIRFCDVCDLEIAYGSVGERCLICDFDLCPDCSSDAPGTSEIACGAGNVRVSSSTDAPAQDGPSSPSANVRVSSSTDAPAQDGPSLPSANVRVSSSTDAPAQDGPSSPSAASIHISAAPSDSCNAMKIHPFFLPRPRFINLETTPEAASAADVRPSCNMPTETGRAPTETDDCDALPPPHTLPVNTPVPRRYSLGAHRMKRGIVLKVKTDPRPKAATLTSLFAATDPQTPSGAQKLNNIT
jgi:hypothetical protein